jgi:maltose alpha-D-glucosyltransferase/alpha-amylase
MHERTEPGAERLAPALVAWEKSTREAFLKAYTAAIAGSGIYPSVDDMRGLLRLAEMEKVLYELRYEANNRPDWIHIPVQGLMALLEGA